MSKITRNKQGTSYYALINGFSAGLRVIVFGAETNQFKSRLSFDTQDINKFVKDFPKNFNSSSYKCVIFNVFQCFNSSCPGNIQTCNELKEQIEKLKIPYYFISNEMLLPSSFLAASKFICEPGDIVFIPVISPEAICSYAYRREADGYVNIRQRAVFPQETKNEKEFRAAFYGGYEPKKIIAFSNPPNCSMLKCLKKIVEPSSKLQIMDINPTQDSSFLVETYKWLCDPVGNSEYYIKPRSTRRFYASSTDRICTKNAEIVIDYNEELPLNRKYAFPRTISRLYLTHSKGEPNPTLHFYKTCSPEAADCHRYELNFSIDKNNFPKASIKNVMIPQIETLPITLTQVMKSRHPVIGFFDNSSVICIFNERTGRYEFLESWNGVYGRDIFLNLKPEKPVLEYKPPTDNTSIITFNEICTFTESQTIPSLNNGLKLIKNSKTESILQFATSDGTEKNSTPSFLLALILKEHYLAIKAQTGIRHEKLGIHFFPKFRDPTKVEEAKGSQHSFAWDFLKTYQVKHEIQVLLKESCNMLRVQYCEDASKALENCAFTLDDSRILVMPPINMEGLKI